MSDSQLKAMTAFTNWIFTTVCLLVVTSCQRDGKGLPNSDVQPGRVSGFSAAAENTEWLGTLTWISTPDSRSAQVEDLESDAWNRTIGREADAMERYQGQWDSYLNGRRTTPPGFAPSPIAELMEIRR